MIKGIHHVAISSPDLDRITKFYKEVIGLEPETEEFAWEPDTDVGELCDTIVAAFQFANIHDWPQHSLHDSCNAFWGRDVLADGCKLSHPTDTMEFVKIPAYS